MVNECERIDDENDQQFMEKKWKKAEAFDKVLNYVIETETDAPGSSFVVQELNDMYINDLKIYGINEKLQTTRFTERLVNSIPTLYSETIDRKTRVLFDYKVKEFITDYVKSPDELFSSLRNMVSPIRKEMTKQCNEFVVNLAAHVKRVLSLDYCYV